MKRASTTAASTPRGYAIDTSKYVPYATYSDVLTTDQMVALGKSLGVSYVSGFSILPIPARLCLPDTLPEPGFTLTNIQSGASWIFAEGGVAPGGCSS